MSADAPLAGRRVLITRTRRQAGQLSVELAKLGAEPIEIPTIEIVPPESFAALDAALHALDAYDWLIVTSANAVRVMEERRTVLKLVPEKFARLKVAAVGATTAHALEELGLYVTLMPKEYVAESLVEALAGHAAHTRVLIVRAAVARDVIPDTLAAQGAQVTVAEAYRTVVPQDSAAKISARFAEDPPDAVTFTSSSTVTNFFRLLHEAGCERPASLRAVSIGPITSQTLREHGWEPSAEADPHDIAGLVEAVIRALR